MRYEMHYFYSIPSIYTVPQQFDIKMLKSLLILLLQITVYVNSLIHKQFLSLASIGYEMASFKSTATNLKRSTKQLSYFRISAKSQNKGSVEKYLQMKELLRLKTEGASYEDLKEASINGTTTNIKWKEQAALTSTSSSNNGYKKFVGKKGSLDQRLRAVISYKRTNIAISEAVALGNAPALTTDEETELEEMMESEDGDDDLEVDDEELQYESLILQAIEKNKLSEVKRNLAMDLRLQNLERYNDKKSNVSSDVTTNNDNFGKSAFQDDKESSKVQKDDEKTNKEDLYTPIRHSWGVFQRPRDISKSYGGGRTISKAEMDKLDEDYELQQKKTKDVQQVFASTVVIT